MWSQPALGNRAPSKVPDEEICGVLCQPALHQFSGNNNANFAFYYVLEITERQEGGS